MSVRNWIQLNEKDNVAVVLKPEGLSKGSWVSNIEVQSDIPKGHKFSLRNLAKGDLILKYGHAIGRAQVDISAGDHVHIHNVQMTEDFEIHENAPTYQRASGLENLNFQGYRRADGSVGIRNYIVVVSTVNCSATVVKAVCHRFLNSAELNAKNIDGVVPVVHTGGCAQAIGGLNYRTLNRTLAGWIFHPNVVGAVVIGLGCEGTTYKSIMQTAKEMDLQSSDTGKIPMVSYGIQEVGGTAHGIERGVSAVHEIISGLPRFTREKCALSHLTLALNCGGSDGFSGITANPLLGDVSDKIVEAGGAVALAEIPECHGAEGLLYSRAKDDRVRNDLKDVFDWWHKYSKQNQVTLNENLAPGNIAGGITTILEKSLGAVAKAGSSTLSEVVGFSRPIRSRGFVLMNTPGFDPVSVTGLVAGGCQMVAFTTGRGSVYGCGIAPTIKISTNSELFKRMPGDMDFDAGSILSGESFDKASERLLSLIIEIASGQRSCSENLGIGWEEFVPWPIGETL